MVCILSNIRRLSVNVYKNANSYYLVFGRHVAANDAASKNALTLILMQRERNPTWRNKRAKDYRLYYEIGGFLQIFPSLCFETHPIKLYGNEKHSTRILSIYLSKFDEKSQNYPFQ